MPPRATTTTALRTHARALATWLLIALAWPALAHDFKLGALVIDHPYALPTPSGARTGATYFRSIANTGDVADKLIGASTPIAASVEFHRSTMDGNVMRMRALDGIELPAGGDVKMRHDGNLHVMLVGIKSPLKEGMSFPMRLRFAHAGEREVTVTVQKPYVRDPGHVH